MTTRLRTGDPQKPAFKEKNKAVAGIYKITFQYDRVEHVYVGQTDDLRQRYIKHLNKLRNGKHDNWKMRRMFKWVPDTMKFEIIYYDLPIEQLNMQEQRWIDHFRLNPRYEILNLCMDVETGIGRGEEHPRYDSTIHLFGKLDGSREALTQQDMREKFDLHHSNVSSLVSGKRVTAQGWCYLGTEEAPRHLDPDVFDKTGANCYNYDATVRIFQHEDKSVFVGTQRQFINEFKLKSGSVYKLIRDIKRTLQGWQYLGEKGKELRKFNKDWVSSNGKKYNFEQWQNGVMIDSFIGTNKEASQYTKLSKQSISDLTKRIDIGWINQAGWKCTGYAQ